MVAQLAATSGSALDTITDADCLERLKDRAFQKKANKAVGASNRSHVEEAREIIYDDIVHAKFRRSYGVRSDRDNVHWRNGNCINAKLLIAEEREFYLSKGGRTAERVKGVEDHLKHLSSTKSRADRSAARAASRAEKEATKREKQEEKEKKARATQDAKVAKARAVLEAAGVMIPGGEQVVPSQPDTPIDSTTSAGRDESPSLEDTPGHELFKSSLETSPPTGDELAEVKTVCADNEPSELAAAFEVRAQEAANRLEQLWRVAEFTDDGKFVQYQLEGQRPSIEDPDRAKVPTLPNGIVSDGAGLQTLTGKTSTAGAQQSEERECATLAIEQPGEHLSQEAATVESATDSPSDRDDWLPAERLNAVVNRVGKEGLAEWKKERRDRKKRLCAKIALWVRPADFDDGSSQHPDPRIYYDGEDLGKRDARLLGLDLEF
ncbi:hypothetical protein B0A54_10719 [Friedmanniomyces endolithicus]|uniref:Uncharacterized protein n=1 Tax=Friedmanniomyces endolithicus TaxID=329885 RepID=A0A4U0UR37_9PEZI|nr:hypothetical protein B0A54_10719 [Friedmanniomyces endolithicus]